MEDPAILETSSPVETPRRSLTALPSSLYIGPVPSALLRTCVCFFSELNGAVLICFSRTYFHLNQLPFGAPHLA